MNTEQNINKIMPDAGKWMSQMLSAQTVLFYQSSEITHNYYLKSGIIKVYYDKNIESSIINLLADEMILPLDSFSNKISFVNMKTLETTILYTISTANYRHLLTNNPIIQQNCGARKTRYNALNGA